MPLARIVVVSDRALVDPDENRAGAVLSDALTGLGCDVTTVCVPTAAPAVRQAMAEAVIAADVVLTTGGTGIRPGDCVVDQTLALGVAELPGIAEEVRRRGAATTSAALLSRGVAGIVEREGRRCLVVNAPSSRGGARDVAAVLAEVWPHLVRDLAGASRD